MPIRPDDFFAAAVALNRLKPPLVSDEVCARTMAGRMYYAAYLATREAIREQIGIRELDVGHSALIAALKHTPDTDVQVVGTRLLALKRLRERADYRPHHHMTKLAVALRMADAQFVLENVPGLRGRLPSVQQRQPPRIGGAE